MKKFIMMSMAALAVASLVGCSSTPVKPVAQVAEAPEWTAGHEPWNDPKNPLYKKSAYFAFDKYELDSAGLEVADTHRDFLIKHPQLKVQIEGNTDERGGREYNVALGQKRAKALADHMILLGVPQNQIETISFGKEKPKALGHDEKSWAENRRADIVYQK